MADWSSPIPTEYQDISPLPERFLIIDAWNKDVQEAGSWSDQPLTTHKPQCTYSNISESPRKRRQSPRKQTIVEGLSKSLQEAPGANVPSASSTRKSRYANTIASLALTDSTTLPSSSALRSRPTSPERPRCPVKVLPDLARAHPPTIQVHINNGKVEDDVLGPIHERVKHAVRRGIFPKSLKDSLRPYIDDLDFEDDRMFSDDCNWNIEAETLLKKVIEIHEDAQYCEDYKRPEACWGDDVVRPILVLALQAAGFGKDVRIDNVASTRIWPSSLVQRSIVGNPIPIDTKKVDYAIFYALPPDRKQRITSQLELFAEPHNLNQTDRPEHRTSVNLLSIEIKTSVSVDDPLLQLAIWASAGLQAITNVFEEDVPAAETIPPSFMMSMRGPECKIAYMKLEPSETDSFLRKLYGDLQIGSAMTVTGLFQIISALKTLLLQSKRLHDDFWDKNFLVSHG